jgi:hypothetical protein
MTNQELNLLRFAAIHIAELGARFAQIVRVRDGLAEFAQRPFAGSTK